MRRTSQSFTVWSLALEMKYRPSPLLSMWVTPSVWPTSTPAGRAPPSGPPPVAIVRLSHTLHVQSSEPEKSTCDESSAHATALTSLSWPSARSSVRLRSTSCTYSDESDVPTTISRPSWLNRADQIPNTCSIPSKPSPTWSISWISVTFATELTPPLPLPRLTRCTNGVMEEYAKMVWSGEIAVSVIVHLRLRQCTSLRRRHPWFTSYTRMRLSWKPHTNKSPARLNCPTYARLFISSTLVGL
mmetsp:Transcript_9411/g.23194  ORF Transcript_9411/g.23194 Transcript_9411/m.23194 type:complete len:243 (-) Transcript_9411:273-1001(-)